MKASEAWKNFNLGEELDISGIFIYNGLRRFHEIRKLDNSGDIFEILYNLSVGLERLLKIAVILIEHDDECDIEELERSLITHNHSVLLDRVRKRAQINFGTPHFEFLALLARFYKTFRYNRFLSSSVYDSNKERDELRGFIGKHLDMDLSGDSLFGTPNDARYHRFMSRLVTKISGSLFEVVRERASALNLYTYELRYESKACTVFLGNADFIYSENVLWKELLIFFMNTESNYGVIEYLRGIEPLDFDPALASDYLNCFQSDAAKSEVVDELESHYSELEKPGERLKMIDIIGNPNIMFESPDDEIEDETSATGNDD